MQKLQNSDTTEPKTDCNIRRKCGAYFNTRTTRKVLAIFSTRNVRKNDKFLSVDELRASSATKSYTDNATKNKSNKFQRKS
mmetsp:Transcript_11339/g.22971  ORF Transcript_11339/g.22971 Transcript_11339/m.22971 type:complete len:81 (+) Transcript_11339:862-1104(+)